MRQSIYLAFLLLPALVHAETSVWKVSKDGNDLYLGGTIHVLSKSDYPLPAIYDEAFALSDAVVFETDLAALTSIGVQQKMAAVMYLPPGNTLESLLNEEVLAELKNYLDEKQIPFANANIMSPAGLSLTLTYLELNRLGIGASEGIDAYYHAKSKANDKTIEALESIDAQIGFLASMNDVDANVLVSSTLRDVAKLESTWETILKGWRSGDLETMNKTLLQPMLKEQPELLDVMLYQRNLNWMENIDAMMEDEDTEFVLVGALHLVGDKGLIAMLKDAGYTLEQL